MRLVGCVLSVLRCQGNTRHNVLSFRDLVEDPEMSITEWQRDQNWIDLPETTQFTKTGKKIPDPPGGLYLVKKEFFITRPSIRGRSKKQKYKTGETYVVNRKEAEPRIQSGHLESISPRFITKERRDYYVMEISQYYSMDEWQKYRHVDFIPYRVLRDCVIFLSNRRDFISKGIILCLLPQQAAKYCVTYPEYAPTLQLLSEHEARAHHLLDDGNESLFKYVHRWQNKGGETIMAEATVTNEGRVKLYKDGDRMGIMTDISNEDDFIDKVSHALENLIMREAHVGDWHFQFIHWLPCIVDICGSMRGYKTNVHKIIETYSGSVSHPDHPVISIDSKGRVVDNGNGTELTSGEENIQ